MFVMTPDQAHRALWSQRSRRVSAVVAAGGSVILTVAVVLAALTYLKPPVALGGSEYVLPFLLMFPVFGWGTYLSWCLTGGTGRGRARRWPTLADATCGLPKVFQALLAAIWTFGAVSLLPELFNGNGERLATTDQNRLFLGGTIVLLTIGVTLSANHWLVRRDFDPYRTQAPISPAVTYPAVQIGATTELFRATAPHGREPATRRSIVRGLASGLIVAGFLGTYLYMTVSRYQPHYGTLRTHGVAGRAVVTSTGSPDQDRICYGFDVGQRRFQSCGTAADYDAAKLQPGQIIRILYDPTNPDLSCACRPAAALPGLRHFAGLGLLFLVLAIVSGVVAERRARDRFAG